VKWEDFITDELIYSKEKENEKKIEFKLDQSVEK